MSEITIKFNYNIPDERWGTTALNKKQADWTYVGPERILVAVDANGKLLNHGAIDADANPGYKFNPGVNTVLVDVNRWPLIGALFYPSVVELNFKPQTHITLPDGYFKVVHEPPLLTEIHFAHDAVYNFSTDSWTVPFATGAETWETIRQKRDGLLEASDKRVNEDAPAELRDAWLAYRQKLRDITTIWEGYSPNDVIFPPDPIRADNQ